MLLFGYHSTNGPQASAYRRKSSAHPSWNVILHVLIIHISLLKDMLSQNPWRTLELSEIVSQCATNTSQTMLRLFMFWIQHKPNYKVVVKVDSVIFWISSPQRAIRCWHCVLSIQPKICLTASLLAENILQCKITRCKCQVEFLWELQNYKMGKCNQINY
jgi:hypothetical protein